jgi:hypothetical protein
MTFASCSGRRLALDAHAAGTRLGIRPLLVTGDNEHAARSVACAASGPGGAVRDLFRAVTGPGTP